MYQDRNDRDGHRVPSNDGSNSLLESLHRQNLEKQMRNIDDQIVQLYKDRKRIEIMLADTGTSLRKMCNHKWELEPPQYQERTWWYCRECGSYK